MVTAGVEWLQVARHISHQHGCHGSWHKKVERSRRFWPMCVGGITNLDLPAHCFDAFDSDEDASHRIEDEHHAIFECSGYATTGANVSRFF